MRIVLFEAGFWIMLGLIYRAFVKVVRGKQ